MFTRHYKKHLSAYAHGELEPEDSERVAAHLQACASCREEFEEIKLGVRLAECLPEVSAPEGLWDAVEAALAAHAATQAQHAPHAQTDARLRPGRAAARAARFLPFSFGPRVAAACAAACFALIACGVWLYVRSARPSWEVAALEGAPRIDSGRIGERGRLAVGEWLETDSASRAEIAVANIGEVQVDPNTRVRLVATR